MVKLYLKQVSSLEKIFLSDELPKQEIKKSSILKNEEFAYQIIYHAEATFKFDCSIYIDSPLSANITVRRVGNVPSELPAYVGEFDGHYLKTEPGLFPDVLYDINYDELIVKELYQSLWIEIKTDEKLSAGNYPITITFKNEEYNICESKTFELEIIDAVLPKQKLIFTQWFHVDSISSFYNLEVFSEEHWELIRKFMQVAADNGVNMILTPIFTPPLDTAIGGERPTAQLVDVFKDGTTYSFRFEKLKRWIHMSKECGITYFEMAHLFTQWGAKATPKIVATENGTLVKIFGWDVSATSKEYKVFLNQFLPALIEFLKAEGVDKQTYFHISDEPNADQIESYSAARGVVEDSLKDFIVFDALSDYKFYESGIVTCPIPANDHIERFLENKVPNLWTYYCCAQKIDVSNRFMAMPSYRNRIIGLQLYKYDIVGFLHWGYNFYYSHMSKRKINPFAVTDADGAFPSGDSFSVYPGENGPLESIRLKVFKHALQDMQALKLLENFISKQDIVELMDKEVNITFKNYPHSADFIMKLREEINEKIKLMK